MVHEELVKKSQNIEWEYTAKAVTSWGGMRMMKELIDKAGILTKLKELPIPYPRSNRGCNPLEIIESFWVCVWAGGVRFSHTAIIRFDKVLKEIFSWKKNPSVSTYTRFFNKFNRQMVDGVFAELNKWFFAQVPIQKFTLDLDSTVCTRYGEQEGSVKGYNPNKRGRNSHHPIIAFLADIRMVANAWLRPGNTSSANNVRAFFEETLNILSSERIGLIRADSGFFDGKFLNLVENRLLKYVVAVKMNALLKNSVLNHNSWLSIDDGIEVGEFTYRAGCWKQERRIIVIRQSVIKRPRSFGKMLFKELPEYCSYKYQLYITNIDLAGAEVWRLYRQRADSENRIKELKHEFGMNGFCLHKFYATEAAFRMVLVAYNLLSLFRQGILKQQIQQTLSTIRFKCFALGGWIVKSGRKKVLKLSVAMQRRVWLDGLFSKLVDFSAPFPIKLDS